MADTPVVPSPPPPPPAPVIQVTLGEFCASVSGADRRVEMIAGFHSDEVRNGRLKDTAEAFTTRYATFQTRPV